MILAFDRTRYPEDYLRRGFSEANVQLVVLARLRQLGCWAHIVDAGAALLRGRAVGALRRAGASTAALVGRTGIAAGISDILGIAPDGRPLFVEVKAPAWLAPSSLTRRLTQRRAAGAPSEDQIAFLLEAERRGAVAGIAWAASDVDAILESARRAA